MRLGALLLGLAAATLLGALPASADEPSPYDDGPTRPAVATTPQATDGDSANAENCMPASPHAPAKKQRRGWVNPCMTPDPGFGVYDAWAGTGTTMGQVLIPHKGGITKNGSFDVIFSDIAGRVMPVAGSVMMSPLPAI